MPKNQVYEPRLARAEHRLSIRGANYCVYEWGRTDAPLLIYLHGWGDTGATFQFVVDSLDSDWRVLAPDWRGFGRSSCECNSYWFPDYLADLDALLDVFSPDRPARLIGHSMGANAAALYSGTMPERVRAFVNAEGFGLADSDPADAPTRYREWIAAEKQSQPFSAYTDLNALAERILKRSPAMALSKATYVANQWAAQEGPDLFTLRADPRHRLPNPVLYRRAEAEACWRAITADMLLVAGSRSRFGFEFGETSLLFGGCARVEIEGAGHMLHFEAPGEFAKVIEDFMLQTL